MCVNCQLLCPLHDNIADLLCIPKRTYLAKSSEVADYIVFTDEKRFPGKRAEDMSYVSYRIRNFETYKLFTEENVEPVVLDSFPGLKLYTGKLVSSNKLPEYDPELYLELFKEV